MSGVELYSLVHGERMHFTVADLYESEIAPWLLDDDLDDEFIVERWSTVSTRSLLMTCEQLAETLRDTIIEWPDEVTEHWTESVEHALREDDEVLRSMCEAMLVYVARCTEGFRMADEKLAEHTLSFSSDGTVMLDGAALFDENEMQS